MKISHRLLFLFLASILIIQGCASAYVGPNPDLSLTGQQAQEEIKKFSFKEDSFWSQNYWYKMGPEKKPYTLESLRPVIASVSTKASDQIAKADKYRNAQWIFLLLGLVSTISTFRMDSHGTQNMTSLALTSYLVSIGLGSAAVAELSSASREYNKDLQQKLSPSLSFNFQF
jgi:hypothetical protein